MSRPNWPRGWPGFSSAFPTLDIVSVADRMGKDPMDVAEVYYDLADRLRITQLMDRIIELPRADRWQSMARASIREDLYAAHAALTADVLAAGNGTVDAGAALQGVGAEERADSGAGADDAGGDPGVGGVRPGQPVGGHADDADAAAHARVRRRFVPQRLCQGAPDCDGPGRSHIWGKTRNYSVCA